MLMSSKKTVLISGAGGFLANYLIKQLSNDHHYEILALTSNKEKLEKKFSNIKNMKCISNIEWDNGLLNIDKVDTLIHCAFATESDNGELAKSLEYTNKLFNYVKKLNIDSVINISSRSVYGNIYKPLWKESLMVAPNTSYGLAKYASELLLEATFAGSLTAFTNLRLASLIGPEIDKRVVSKFVESAIKDHLITINGGKQVFSYLDVRDASDAILTLLSLARNKWEKVYNVGHFERNSIIEIAEIVANTAIRYFKDKVEIVINENDTVLDIGMDCEMFYRQCDWVPKYNMHDTVDELFKYYLS